jgi:hypothetical protein
MPRATRGPVELAAARTLKALDEDVPGKDVLSASVLVLARALDQGAGLATAAVARELRATVEALTKGGGDDSDPATAALFARLSSPLGNGRN